MITGSRQLARAMADMAWTAMADGSIDFVNDKAKAYSGSSAASPGDMLDAVHPDDRATMLEGWAAAFRHGEAFEIEVRGRRHDSMYRWCRIRIIPVLGKDGAVDHWFGTSTDVHESHESLQALRLAQQHSETLLVKLQRILDHSVDAICSFTADGTCVEMSARCRDIWGYEPDELIGRHFGDLIHPDDRENSRQHNMAIREGQQVTTMLQRHFRKNGGLVYIQWSSVWSADDHLFFNIARDVTAQIEAETRLRQAQRLETLGQLTGGVAHDFNNLLTVILGNAEFLAEQLPPDGDLHQMAIAMQDAAERGSALNRRLLAFARRQALEPRVSDINALMGSMDHLLRRTLGEQVEIEMVRAGGLWRGFVDAGQLESAVLNLCLNARDAMPGGGRLTIETANAYLDGTYAASHEDVTPGQYVMIAVSDTGDGMPPDVVSRAFEPFFTTKDVGKGSGLGLSMVYGFVKQSGGHIKIYSELGQGTVIRLYLPRTRDADHSTDASASRAASPSGTDKILLVEDDDLVRVHVEKQLLGLGYSVVAVSSGPQALEVLRNVADFDLLFTDVVMPGGMNGQQLAAEARRLQPRLPVLFSSGYTENAIIHHGRLDPGVHLLNKPYRREEMARKVREVLGLARESAPQET
ncbi:PAS domain S-box protein [Emcibacter sp. SYSU 3D8]|uniref:hybrid sensor histidine kinase/response regulator n=1 Tax=Emcibacter sp. SYSU 3D8 TaxID=3133969 RepID=UPI0031FF3B3F